MLTLQARIDALEGRDPGTLQMRIAELEQQLSVRNQALFGDKSEKRNRQQRRAEQEEGANRARPSRPGRAPARIEQVHTLDAADEMCPKCGGELQVFDGQFEEADEVDVVERRFVLVKHKRQKYRCDCGCIETAEGPPKLQKSGRYSIGFATAVAVGKYADHLPLQRQVVQMRRQGLRIDSQTLWDQLFALSEHCAACLRGAARHVLSHPVVGADETTWRLMGKKAVTNTKRWQVWALSAPDAVVYQLHPSRGADAAAQLLQDFSGTVMCDGYSAYQSLKKRRHDFKLAHCWAHARRKFVEIEESFPKQSEEALELIAELYRIEREIDDRASRRTTPDSATARRSRGATDSSVGASATSATAESARQSDCVPGQTLRRPTGLPHRPGRAARQQPYRACAARCRGRKKESLRLALRARHPSGRDDVLARRDREDQPASTPSSTSSSPRSKPSAAARSRSLISSAERFKPTRAAPRSPSTRETASTYP